MFDQLKPIMQNGERYIVVEGGRPEYVLMRFSDYARIAGHRESTGVRGEYGRAPGQNPGEWERANAELEEVRATEPAARTADFGTAFPSADPTTIRLEDLPL